MFNCTSIVIILINPILINWYFWIILYFALFHREYFFHMKLHEYTKRVQVTARAHRNGTCTVTYSLPLRYLYCYLYKLPGVCQGNSVNFLTNILNAVINFNLKYCFENDTNYRSVIGWLDWSALLLECSPIGVLSNWMLSYWSALQLVDGGSESNPSLAANVNDWSGLLVRLIPYSPLADDSSNWVLLLSLHDYTIWCNMSNCTIIYIV